MRNPQANITAQTTSPKPKGPDTPVAVGLCLDGIVGQEVVVAWSIVAVLSMPCFKGWR
jgi:hypothetical protein